MLQQVKRGGAQQQVLPGPLAAAPPLINQPAQHREQTGCAVNFVEDDQFVQMVGQIQLGLCEFRAVAFRLQVQINTRQGLSDFQRQRGLADLAWPEQGYRRGVLKFFGK